MCITWYIFAPSDRKPGATNDSHMSRNSVAVYDADLARKQAQAELRDKAAPKKLHEVNKLQPQQFKMSEEGQAKMAEAFRKELIKMKALAEERRRRDPTFREDAVDLDQRNVRKFNKFIDYCKLACSARRRLTPRPLSTPSLSRCLSPSMRTEADAQLGVDCFASPTELKEAYRNRSRELHPDKLINVAADERVAAEERYHLVQKAYDILTEPATRQLYDRARAKLEANYEAGVVNTEDEATKPPPTCVDILVPLEELFCGCRKVVRYTRKMFEGTQWEKKSDDTFKLDIRPGELEGATFWFKNQGDVSTGGKADLVFVVSQEPHALWERVGDDLWWKAPADLAPVPSDATFFTQSVPSLEGAEKKRVGTVVKTVGIVAEMKALGHCLAAQLGFDRSGVAEAVITGKVRAGCMRTCTHGAGHNSASTLTRSPTYSLTFSFTRSRAHSLTHSLACLLPYV